MLRFAMVYASNNDKECCNLFFGGLDFQGVLTDDWNTVPEPNVDLEGTKVSTNIVYVGGFHHFINSL